MLVKETVSKFLDTLASNSPAPGGGSTAALAGALGSALTSMVCRLTIGKKKYAENEAQLKIVLKKSEELRETFAALIDKDTEAFNKVMEAMSLPKESDDQKAMRNIAVQQSTKEACLVPLEVMTHIVDALALAKTVAEKGNANSVSDAGVSALMLNAAMESAALNVQINLSSIKDTEFVGWKTEELSPLLHTAATQTQEIMSIVKGKIGG
jgi:formiminotetrahydrofolate cyclodeaminase